MFIYTANLHHKLAIQIVMVIVAEAHPTESGASVVQEWDLEIAAAHMEIVIVLEASAIVVAHIPTVALEASVSEVIVMDQEEELEEDSEAVVAVLLTGLIILGKTTEECTPRVAAASRLWNERNQITGVLGQQLHQEPLPLSQCRTTTARDNLTCTQGQTQTMATHHSSNLIQNLIIRLVTINTRISHQITHLHNITTDQARNLEV